MAKDLIKLNFTLCATKGTAKYIQKYGMKCRIINKVSSGSPHIVDVLDSKKIDIDKLKSEKRKVQLEYDDVTDQLKRDMEKKLEREKRDLNDQLQREIEEIEREEKIKFIDNNR